MAKRDLRNSLTAGDTLEVVVDNVAHGGIFVARTEHGVVFVPEALPGERVRVEVSRVQKSFAHSELLEVLEPSSDRVEHFWPEARLDRAPDHRAGGAEFGHIKLAKQRELKTQVLREAMQRFGGVEADARVVAAPGDNDARGLGWRTRVRLQVSEAGRQGPFAARTHNVVPVSSLPLAAPSIQRDALLHERLVGAAIVDYVALADGSTDIIASEAGAEAGRSDTIVELVGDREFQLDRAGFWQVHREAPALLTDAVRRAIDVSLADPKAANLDLYGGVGLFAAALGDLLGSSTRVTSVEGNEIATDHAAENLAEWVGAQTATASVQQYLKSTLERASAAERDRFRAATVVLDPPRAGAGEPVIDLLADYAPAQLVYVACDPVALARDTGLLRARGYELATLESYDLFPHTHHLESVAAFRRA
ncbi:MAG: class I SAM-dependent RNA methyltransferase [Agrococcus casei]|uniref:class I SAM-dependent RNA methyltransferase n=1 Tax=Agrococcus casei TaxID=343512 RepID=UPI003F90693B